jgi:hypothetical protein
MPRLRRYEVFDPDPPFLPRLANGHRTLPPNGAQEDALTAPRKRQTLPLPRLDSPKSLPLTRGLEGRDPGLSQEAGVCLRPSQAVRTIPVAR